MSDQIPGGMPDMQALLQQAQAMQEQLLEAREAAAQQVVDGVAAGGKVTITAMGDGSFQSVRIAPELAEDVEMLEDLLLAALRDLNTKLKELNEDAADALGIFG